VPHGPKRKRVEHPFIVPKSENQFQIDGPELAAPDLAFPSTTNRDGYSVGSACMGSIDAARRAGLA